MTNFVIDVVSDPVCPWCYIGKKRLEKAIALYKKVYPSGRRDTFTVTWTAYYLDPTAPTTGISYSERMMQKLSSSGSGHGSGGGARQKDDDDDDKEALAARLTARLASIGQQEGIPFSFRGRIGSTRSAHRAILFSQVQRQTQQTQTQTQASTNTNTNTNTNNNNHDAHDDDNDEDIHNRFVGALFAAYFEGDADITSHADLAAVAAAAGLDRAAVLAWLDGGRGGDEVDGEDRAAKARGVRGVPCFTVQGDRLDGAQDVQDFLELFIKIKETEQAKE